MDYEDRPRPGRGFLWLVSAVWGGTALLCLLVLIRKSGAISLQDITAVILSLTVTTAICGFLLALGYRMVFTLGSDTLTLRSGVIYKKIRFESIRRIARVSSWWHWFHPPFFRRQGFCNRFSDYVVLELKNDLVVFTPSDPERFIAVLQDRMQCRPGNSQS